MRRPPAPRRRIRRTVVVLVGGTLLALTASSPAAAQEEEAPRDTVAADTVAAPPDTAIGDLPGELVGALADSAAAATFAVLADPLAPDPDLRAGDEVVWDRARIRRSNALHLGELLAEMLPGTLLLRDGFVGGPAHLLEGPLGPTGLEIRVDGRPLLPLSGAQPDLSRILLAMIDEVRVRRHAGGVEVELTTLRRTDRRAYSRVEAGSGDPDIENLRLVFTNGLGASFAARAGFELLDAASPASDLQGFSGGLAWLPGGGTSGVELQYDQRSFEREAGAAAAGTRSRLVLGSRIALAEDVQAGAWVARATRELDDPPAGGDGAADLRDVVVHGGAELRAVSRDAWGAIGVRLAEDPAMATREVRLEGGVRPVPWLAIDGVGRLGAWEDFDSRELRLGVAADLAVAGADVRVHGSAGSGRRGAPYLASDVVASDARAPEPVEHDAVAGGVDVAWGPFSVGGRLLRQQVDRQVPFGTGFDDPARIEPDAEVVAWEVNADVPVLPMSWLVGTFDPIGVRGVLRQNAVEEGAIVPYVPARRLRGEIYFEDSFLEDDLGIRIALGVDQRDPWHAPAPGGGDPVIVDERTSLDFDLGIRILDALLFWRYDNVDGRVQQDLPDAGFPTLRQVFGVRWAFYD